MSMLNRFHRAWRALMGHDGQDAPSASHPLVSGDESSHASEHRDREGLPLADGQAGSEHHRANQPTAPGPDHADTPDDPPQPPKNQGAGNPVRDVARRALHAVQRAHRGQASSSAASDHSDQSEQTATELSRIPAPLSLDRVENYLTGQNYVVTREHDPEDTSHECLKGSWNNVTILLDIPPEHDGWLLVSADSDNPVAPVDGGDLLAIAANDWNRERFFPSVSVLRTAVGWHLRAIYMQDMRAGVTDEQLELHVDTGLSACVQALREVRPLLLEGPESI